MVSGTEQSLVRLVRKALALASQGQPIEHFNVQFEGQSEGNYYLADFIEEVIHEVHPECPWTDGLMPAVSLRVGPDEFLVAGNSWMLGRDSSFVAPFHLQLQISPTADEVTWLECRLGERDGDRIKRSQDVRVKQLAMLAERVRAPDSIGEIDWFYKVTFGEHRDHPEG